MAIRYKRYQTVCIWADTQVRPYGVWKIVHGKWSNGELNGSEVPSAFICAFCVVCVLPENESLDSRWL